jgi:hypothetical protein
MAAMTSFAISFVSKKRAEEREREEKEERERKECLRYFAIHVFCLYDGARLGVFSWLSQAFFAVV